MIARFVIAVSITWTCATFAQVPLIHGHAHNDYWHAQPLVAALNAGLCSVEADVHLIGGELRVGHSPEEATADRTLKKLYLNPLKARTGGPPITLLIDVKSEGRPTYAALKELLSNYQEILTSYHDDRVEMRAVTVVLSGGYPRQTIFAEKTRWVACDGGLEDLDATAPPLPNLVPQVQAKWTDHFTWRGESPIPPAEREQLVKIVAKAHEQHRRIRFWAIPDRLNVWRELRADGVDLINTDDLRGCADFLREEAKR